MPASWKVHVQNINSLRTVRKLTQKAFEKETVVSITVHYISLLFFFFNFRANINKIQTKNMYGD